MVVTLALSMASPRSSLCLTDYLEPSIAPSPTESLRTGHTWSPESHTWMTWVTPCHLCHIWSPESHLVTRVTSQHSARWLRRLRLVLVERRQRVGREDERSAKKQEMSVTASLRLLLGGSAPLEIVTIFWFFQFGIQFCFPHTMPVLSDNKSQIRTVTSLVGFS